MAPLYQKALDADKRNPDSKVFFSGLHYLVFDVSGGQIAMKVLYARRNAA